MRKIVLFIALLLPFAAAAQSEFADILLTIEQNNPTLATLRKQADADKLSSRMGLAPTDPEVEFHYLWGSSGATANRMDISIKQSFDFPSLYAYKSKVAKLSNEQFDLQYNVGRMELLTAVRQLCVNTVYYNAMIAVTENRIEVASRMSQGYATRLKNGDGTTLENNRAQLTLATLQSDLQEYNSSREACLLELRGFNADQPITLNADKFESTLRLPNSFDDWATEAVQRNPLLQHALGQVAVSEKQTQVARAQWLPKISVGYMSERVLSNEHFQGVTAGISLPLWENSRAVNAAKASAIAQKYRAHDVQNSLKTRLGALYQRASGLFLTMQSYNAARRNYSNIELLEKALAAGHISLFEYIVELQSYNSVVDKAMQAERDFQLCYCELLAFEL